MRRFLQYLSDSTNVPSMPMSPVAPSGMRYTAQNSTNATKQTPASEKKTVWYPNAPAIIGTVLNARTDPTGTHVAQRPSASPRLRSGNQMARRCCNADKPDANAFEKTAHQEQREIRIHTAQRAADA